MSDGTKMGLINVVLFSALFAASLAKVVTFLDCPETNNEFCEISEVRITPCARGKNCGIRKEENATLSFDFTPKFSSHSLKTMVYWDNGSSKPEQFPGFGSNDACSYTPCPIEPGKKQTYNYNLFIDHKLPVGTYPLKWKIWCEGDPEAHVCCFKTTIRLSKMKPKSKA